MAKTTDPGIHLLIRGIPPTASQWAVTRAIAKVLHADDFKSFVSGRPINFLVKLNMIDDGSIRNDGTGTLTLPIHKSGYEFLKYIQDDPVEINSKGGQQQLQFKINKRRPSPGLVELLTKTRYVSPDLEEDHQHILRALAGLFRVTKVQFGVFYLDKYPSTSCSFSVEWERDYTKSSASLSFDYDHKLFRLELGSSFTDSTYYGLSLNFSNIKRIAFGTDHGTPYIYFEIYAPPILDTSDVHRDPTNDSKFKQRISSLDERHEQISPYAPHLRLELYRDSDITNFKRKCKEAGILDSQLFQFPPLYPLENTSVKKFFALERLHKVRRSLEKIDWPVAFQLECLLLNGLLNTDEFDQLMPKVKSLVNNNHSTGYIGELLRRFNQDMRSRKVIEPPTDCFERTRTRFDSYSILRTRNNSRSNEAFRCYHVTFTPTRMILEGPYPTQSNQVIRKYPGFDDHFIRVDFRDETRLSYQWHREIDRTSFLKSHIGNILKEGFTLAGRHFQFLAWSNSSLGQHAFWFIRPFVTKEGWVTSKSIRDSVGDFAGTKLIKLPWKYAARIGQHFTSTYPSVTILRDERKDIEDLECPEDSYLFTDGVGTISRDLAGRIWAKSCENSGGPTSLSVLEPSAYQIRLLGYKGVVAIDEELDRSGEGIHMCLRESMRKFDVKNDEEVVIEIAQHFNKPINAYLNRALIMVLEDVGVRKEAFLDLQATAVAEAYCIGDSVQIFESVVRTHSFGSAFGLSGLLLQLRETCNLDLELLQDPFIRKLQHTVVDDILHNIKYGARIPIPDSFLFVGAADEGPAYERRGYKNVFCLAEGEICVCIQKQVDAEPVWLKGAATISRSPIIHIGDVQRVRLIGEPPKDMICFFRHLRNVVVLPSRGNRSLASCLSGGDLDGDMFSVICCDRLLPTILEEAASYQAPRQRTPLKRDCTVDDLCDFAVEYIGSDVIALLSDKLLIMADQSDDGMRDRRCQYIGKLCSQAVDFPKQGIPVSLKSVPRPPLRPQPDWKDTRPPSDSPRKGDTDFYESSRALGHLFRAVSKPKKPSEPEQSPNTNPMSDQITGALFKRVQDHLGASALPGEYPSRVVDIFNSYQDELRYICSIHALTNGEDISETEVVIGTILAASVDKQWRKSRIYRMREHVQALVRETKQAIRDSAGMAVITNLGGSVRVLQMAWNAWFFGVSNRKEFGANSFSLIALCMILDCLGSLAGTSL